MKYIIFGDSHTVAVKEAWAAMPPEVQQELVGSTSLPIGMLGFGAKFLEKFHSVKNEEIHLVDSMAVEFEKLVKGSNGVIKRDSSYHYIISLGFHGVALFNYKMWENFTVSRTKPNKHYFSNAALGELVQILNSNIFKFLADMKTLNIQFSVMAAAPLPRTYLDGKFHPFFEAAEILDLRAKYIALVSEHMDSNGYDYVMPPAGVTEDGFLRPELGQTRQVGDFHGNPKYGDLLLRKIFYEVR